MVDATRAQFFAQLLGRRKAEVCDGDAQAIVEAEHVLRLQVSVIYSKGMAILHCVQ